MRRTRIMKVGILAAILVALAPIVSYAATGRMLANEDDIGRGRRLPRISAVVAAPTGTTPARPASAPQALTGQVLPAGPLVPESPVHYTVRPGDSLWQIARHHGLSVDMLASANGFDGRKVLREGMDLLIPWSNVAGTAQYGVDGPVVNGQGPHFVASITRQTCWLFQDTVIVASWTCSTGRPGSPSIPGNYTIQTKQPRAYSAAADFWMPFWLGVYDAGIYENGIYGAETGETRWQDLLGTPITYGCIMLDDTPAEALYDLAYIGIPVTILPRETDDRSMPSESSRPASGRLHSVLRRDFFITAEDRAAMGDFGESVKLARELARVVLGFPQIAQHPIGRAHTRNNCGGAPVAITVEPPHTYRFFQSLREQAFEHHMTRIKSNASIKLNTV
jgi:LysM repeat protein